MNESFRPCCDSKDSLNRFDCVEWFVHQHRRDKFRRATRQVHWVHPRHWFTASEIKVTFRNIAWSSPLLITCISPNYVPSGCFNIGVIIIIIIIEDKLFLQCSYKISFMIPYDNMNPVYSTYGRLHKVKLFENLILVLKFFVHILMNIQLHLRRSKMPNSLLLRDHLRCRTIIWTIGL